MANNNDVLYLHILIISTASGGTLGSASSGHAAGSAVAIRRVNGKVNVLLGVGSDQEGRNVHDLLADADVSLSDKDASVVDGLGKVKLENLGLKSALHENLCGQLKDVIQGVLVLGKEAVSLQAADKGRGLEKALGVLSVAHEKGSGSL